MSVCLCLLSGSSACQIDYYVSMTTLTDLTLSLHCTALQCSFPLAAQLESQLNNNSGKNVRTDIMKVTEERDALLARAERAEKALEDREGGLVTRSGQLLGSQEDKTYSDEIVSLKENILRLDSERAALQNMLTQREKTIELLEEDLRGPVPFETARY